MQSPINRNTTTNEFSLAKGQDEVLQELKKGERSAQLAFYKHYAPKMMGITMRYCSSREDAMEVLNNGFLSIFQSIHKYKPSGSLVAWMSTIVRRKAIDHVRRKKTLFVAMDHGEEQVQIEPEVIHKINEEYLLEFVQKLPNATRVVFNLFVFEDMKHSEIADELGISINTSKWHLANARKIIQQSIKSDLQ